MQSENKSLSLKLALSYSVFLLLCLFLAVSLFISSTRNARLNFWRQQAVRLENSIQTMDEYINVLDAFTRQALSDSTYIRFANMKSLREYGSMMTAYYVKNKLAERAFDIGSFPTGYYGIYLHNIGYVISGSQFTEVNQYYRAFRHFNMDNYDLWLESLLGAGSQGGNVPMEPFNASRGGMMYVRNMNANASLSLPASIFFEWDMTMLRRLFIPHDLDGQALLIATDPQGQRQLLLGLSGEAMLEDTMESLDYDADGFASFEGWQVLRRISSARGVRYMLALPRNLCDAALGNYDALFFAILFIAALMGAGLVWRLVRLHLRPIERLGSRLMQAESDRDQLRRQVDSNRPAVCAAYLRRLVAGNVSSEEEFRFIMEYLGLKPGLRHYILYASLYRQDAKLDTPETYQIVSQALGEAFKGNHPVFFYSTPDMSFIALASYDDSCPDPLMDLQSRVLDLHNRLLAEHALWFFAGVGKMAAQPVHLWESFEQARMAARYTAKHHIFLPYEMMQKDSGTAYYPIEISAKLLHFITLGNKAQVARLLALIYQENINERALPINRLHFLLSDLRNTLQKARFSVTWEDAALNRLDAQLAQEPTFSLCETIALSLCDLFHHTKEPGDLIPKIESYLQSNYADPSLCLTKLSDLFNISESYLSHLFKEKTTRNFSTYLEELRMSEARLRLGQADCELSSLYLEVGYNNAASFRRAFKKRFGITPSAMKGE